MDDAGHIEVLPGSAGDGFHWTREYERGVPVAPPADARETAQGPGEAGAHQAAGAPGAAIAFRPDPGLALSLTDECPARHSGASAAAWRNTTHDWAGTVDAGHLSRIRDEAAAFAPGGLRHLVLEVVAYAADEAESRGGGRCTVTLHADGSVSVADDGRGTDTRLDAAGRPVRKPVMATKDLRFFDHPEPPPLPDGHPRRGMSVVAALSAWLVHTNRRAGGAWTQRYEYGVPATGLTPVADDGTTGTLVHFRPGDHLPPPAEPGEPASAGAAAWAGSWPYLSVEVDDRRTGVSGPRLPPRPPGAGRSA
ncbi:ATP-binding protein [Streptomyces goshikiensis]|uniref:ATP-binding protein n=1 Tax=Streptomyces goshikiensis TaxID=1942 RepID=UPI00364EF19F